ncbi:VWA domain-containing protein [Rhizobium lusitanum]|uniref:VWA domain-containing protein n=1 Tax=Rhizobium lusitanum TaxID=293958 RepID=A0A6L9U9W3_9HYPH|nr:VWA domain-containing protein [Rhizobium lusitanum]NEI72344.1 VWA domain-containing protein [Rhizobium lusitanum]
MYELALPWLLLLLPVPLLAWRLLPPRHSIEPSVRLPFFDDVAKAAGITPSQGSVIAGRTRSQAAMQATVWCLLVVALARPQFIEPPIEKSEPQRDILLALDLSQSMDTRDFAKPDGSPEPRVEAVKQTVTDFIAKRTGDRIGLIAFGDAPYPLAPFTMDHPLVSKMVANLLPGIAGPRTALGDSLGLAIRMFDKTNMPEKVLILLTDGNDTASRMPPLKAAEIARTKGITIHTIGIGDPKASGEDKLDMATLQQIAAKTGGRYFFGSDQTSLSAIYNVLDAITPQAQRSLSWRPRIELFPWPLAAAVLLLSGWYLSSGMIGVARRRFAG